jgi:4-diphosphocytidyl-2-C-methyl-D-erythritol kinase
MSRLSETAYAKINLALHVRRRREDGYHDLESIFAFVEDGDFLEVEAADQISLSINGRFAAGLSAGNDNLVMCAAIALQERFGVTAGARIFLEKSLPIASGIGGGSADAAAALRLLCKLWKIDVSDPKLHQIAASLGADVPACLVSKPVVGLGRGDELTSFDGLISGTPALLVNPLVPLSTGPVFAAWDQVDRGALNPNEPETWRNDLSAPAISKVPEIRSIIETLSAAAGVRVARMSGSGATCFALFDSTESCTKAAVPFSHMWTLITRLR